MKKRDAQTTDMAKTKNGQYHFKVTSLDAILTENNQKSKTKAGKYAFQPE